MVPLPPRCARGYKLQSWAKHWANLRPSIGIYVQNLGPTGTFWATPVTFALRSINPSWEGGHIPYDPPRPWVDADGQWYMGVSVDACNGTNTTAGGRCPAGGRLAMWRSPALRGPRAAWRQV